MSTTTSRLGLINPIGTDGPSQIRVGITSSNGILDNAAIWEEGTFVSRPSVGTAVHGVFWRSTDSGELSYNTGSVWVPVGLFPKVVTGTVSAVSGQMINCEGNSSYSISLPSLAAGALVGITNFTPNSHIITVTGTNINGLGLGGASSFSLGTYGATATLLSDGGGWGIVAGQQDTGWVTITSLGSGVSANNGYLPGARLVGDRVYLSGELTAAAASAWATLSAPFTPSAAVIRMGGGPSGAGINLTSGGALTTVATGSALPLEGISYRVFA